MFKKVLRDANEIASFIIETSPNDVDEELVFEYFFGCKAILRNVGINELQIEDTNHHIRLKCKEKRYQKLLTASMPPIIVENGKVIDGNHRLRIAKRRGLKKIAVYDIITL